MTTLKVDKIEPATGTAIQLGDSGDTITVPAGVTFTLLAACSPTLPAAYIPNIHFVNSAQP